MVALVTPPVLVTRDLGVRRGGRDVLRGVGLTVAPGEVVAVLGPNGAGKSTLVGAVAGTLPAATGEVVYGGRVAAVLQTPGLAARTARANVELALAWWGTPRRRRRARADAALTAMHADHLARRRAASLSGGEQRRVHLARAVAVGADLTLLDEPFDGLDPATHTALRDDTVAALRASGGATLVVLHDRADAWAVADRVVVLLDGRVRADDTPRALLAAPPTVDVARFLGYDGEISRGEDLVLTRAEGVSLDPDGEVRGTVQRSVPTEDGARVHVAVDGGSVWALGPSALTPGAEVGVRLEAPVRYRPDGRRAEDPS